MWMKTGLLLVCLLTGCAVDTQQQRDAENFAQQSVEAGKLSEQALVLMHRGINGMAHRQQRLLLTRDSGIPPRQDLPLEHTVQRVAAARALQQYGKALRALLRQERTPEAAATFNGLLDSTQTALGMFLPAIVTKQIRAMGDTLGQRHYFGQKITQARLLMNAYQPAVTQLAGLLAEDFEPDGSGYMALYLTSAAELRNTAKQVLTGGQPGPARRQAALAALNDAEQAEEQGQALGARMVAMATALHAAQQEAVRNLEQPADAHPALDAYSNNVSHAGRVMQFLLLPAQGEVNHE
ncbi:hypothetical protein CYR55_01945 [Chimaeribacter californicus]|uniref:Uncharacterized protein n=1 Tax=Chimaeribacter californicus TaxID=2060067 RepID=A0A2N5EGD5_9GAMM|nr:hypothetical protein [Chimaeribacter californicus]PLR41617.1 hypothetical protein CYR55_01945 [Chimaeribacter californicus]